MWQVVVVNCSLVFIAISGGSVHVCVWSGIAVPERECEWQFPGKKESVASVVISFVFFLSSL